MNIKNHNWKNKGKLKCPECKSVRLRRDGIAHGRQRYFCKRCEKRTISPFGARIRGRCSS